MLQTKAQKDRNPQEQLNEEETGNLPEKGTRSKDSKDEPKISEKQWRHR